MTSRDAADLSSEMVLFFDKFMHASRNQLSVYDSSEGTLFLPFVAIILSHPEAPRVFALDNVDNALNPKLTRKLVEQISRVASTTASEETSLGARQVFLTSHHPTALDAFDLFSKDQRVFVVRRNELGHTTVGRLEPPTQVSLRMATGHERQESLSSVAGRRHSWSDGRLVARIGVVCEGPADFHAITSFFGHSMSLTGIPVKFVPLQPDPDATAPEGGWGHVLLWLAARLPDMTEADALRHVLAPAIESTETWCVAAFSPLHSNFEGLSGPDLANAFMCALEKSESRPLKPPYANADKTPDRRLRFCEACASRSGRIIDGSPRFREAHDQLHALADSIAVNGHD